MIIYRLDTRSDTAAYPKALDAVLRSAFDPSGGTGEGYERVSVLIRKIEQSLMASIYHWTGHFPEKTRALLRHLAERADAMGLAYPHQEETTASVGLTTLVTALAMNHIERGAYLG